MCVFGKSYSNHTLIRFRGDSVRTRRWCSFFGLTGKRVHDFLKNHMFFVWYLWGCIYVHVYLVVIHIDIFLNAPPSHLQLSLQPPIRMAVHAYGNCLYPSVIVYKVVYPEIFHSAHRPYDTVFFHNSRHFHLTPVWWLVSAFVLCSSVSCRFP